MCNDSKYETGSEVDMGLELLRGIVRKVYGGVYRCPQCECYYDPTYGSCPNCKRFTDAPDDWPTLDEVMVIEAGHRKPPALVSWNSGPVLFDAGQVGYEGDGFFGRCLRCGGLLYEDGFCPKCRR